MKIKSLNHVGIRVKDMDAATRFYVDLLGLTKIEKKPNWLSIDDGQMVHLMPATEESNDGHDIGDLARHVALEVVSLETTVDFLLQKGLKPFQSELGKDPARKDLTDSSDLTFGIGTIFVADPDGNIVEFVDLSRGIFKEVLSD